MSRSRKKRPFAGFAGGSDKEDKRRANRVERQTNRRVLKSTGDETRLKTKREVSDPWWMRKDGKIRIDPKVCPKDVRK